MNGTCQGSYGIERGDAQRALESCPQLWDYLNTAGSEGWAMSGALNGTVTHGPETSSLTSYVFLSRQR